MKPLRRAIGLLLLVALAIGPTVAVAVAADKTAREAHLQHEMERLFAQRTVDPVAFVAQTRTLEAQPAPTTLAQREFLRFLRANRLTLEGRIAEALAEAMPLAEAAESPALRLRAGALVVSLHGFAREADGAAPAQRSAGGPPGGRARPRGRAARALGHGRHLPPRVGPVRTGGGFRRSRARG